MDYPVTPGCFQPKFAGKNNAVFSLLSNDLSTLIYSTYMGGSGDSNLRANCFAPDGSIWVAGWTSTTNFPTKNAYQTTLQMVNGKTVNALVLARFKPVPAGGLHAAK